MAYTGMIKTFNPSKGWGFIECAETFALANKDIFVLKSALQAGTATPGDTVRFDVQQGQKGPEATNVITLMSAAMAPMQGLGMQGLGMQRPAMSAPQGYPTAAAAAGGGFGKTRGTVKSFNAVKGWGFISSPALANTLGKDIFFMKSSIQGGLLVQQGSEVTFTVANGNKGPEAKDVALVGGMSAPAPGGMPAGVPAGLAAVIAANPALRALIPGMGGGAAAGGGAPGMVAPKSVTGQSFVGTIKGFNEEKGWGHIECDTARKEFGKDIFFTKAILNPAEMPEVGALVSVKVGMTPKGPTAESMKIMPAAAFQQVFTGEVRSFKDTSGWGFLSSPEVTEVFGKDIFLHAKEMGGVNPAVGSILQFTVEVSTKGQLQAKNVAMADGSAVVGTVGGPQAAAGFPGGGGVMQPPPGAQGYSPY